MSLEKYYGNLEKYLKERQALYEKRETSSRQNIAEYDRKLQDKKSSQAEQVRSLVGKALEIEGLERLLAEIMNLNLLCMLTTHVQMMAIDIATAITKLEESGSLQKKDLEDMKKMRDKIEEFQRLLEESYKKAKRTEESRKKNLSYVL